MTKDRHPGVPIADRGQIGFYRNTITNSMIHSNTHWNPFSPTDHWQTVPSFTTDVPDESYDASASQPETMREMWVQIIQIIGYIGIMYFLFGTGLVFGLYNMLGFDLSVVLLVAVIATIAFVNHLYHKYVHWDLRGETPEEKEQRLEEEKLEKEHAKWDAEYYIANEEDWFEVDEDREEWLGECKNYDENGVVKYD